MPKPNGAHGKGHGNIELNSESGMIILDVVDGIIVHDEILFREKIRNQLIDVLP